VPTVRKGTVTDDRSDVLLIRVWLEDDTFRARLTAVDGAPAHGPRAESTFAVAASPGDVVAAVERWLAQFVQRDGTASG
jgi:hypothetical protein